jgi:hypothetical protein
LHYDREHLGFRLALAETGLSMVLFIRPVLVVLPQSDS